MWRGVTRPVQAHHSPGGIGSLGQPVLHPELGACPVGLRSVQRERSIAGGREQQRRCRKRPILPALRLERCPLPL